MKKSKLLITFLSIALSSIIMFSVFTSDIFREPEMADAKIYGVNGKFREIGENLLNIFYDEKQKDLSENEKKSELPMVYIGGYPIGLKLYADGVVIVGTEAVDTEKGTISTADKAGLKIGDIIKKVNNVPVENNVQVSELIEKSEGEDVLLTVEREGKELDVTFNAVYSVSEGKYKAGLWIRDSSAGIGTVTFCTQHGRYASLGHAVCDIDTKTTLPISRGECTNAVITGYTKGGNGTAGELCGYLESDSTGVVYSNEDIGVYGEFNVLPKNFQLFQIAHISEVHKGEAEIYTTVENGMLEKFSVMIESVDSNSTDHKNLILKVTDRALIEKTGGIIQGMSGSPIVQNGKIIGAVTHVFLNDATGGYGIFAETMLENLNEVCEEFEMAS